MLRFVVDNSQQPLEKDKNIVSVDCNICKSRNFSVFNNLSTTELAHFNDHKSCIVYKKGQYIFHENGYPHGIYCVNAGKVKIVRTGKDGKDQIVRLARKGDILGYRALLGDSKYNGSAITLEDTNVCFISKTSFFNVIQSNRNLSSDIIKMLAGELGKAEQSITDISQKSVKERMAEALLLLKDTYGFEQDGATIAVKLSREDIASLLGIATETAIRLLSVFKKNGVIEFVGKKIKILDIEQLLKAANSNE